MHNGFQHPLSVGCKFTAMIQATIFLKTNTKLSWLDKIHFQNTETVSVTACVGW